ncbi:hypothetical protein PV04_09617 [Phialophora macrospora]|uniref:Glucose-repressible protein n=1 Tax=Phialophora macrospora TaxID=1851006 RepID=A0A0D2FCV6_9EURO|nr:hypothetical protein PV04_09617 [Phialophora macrospora]
MLALIFPGSLQSHCKHPKDTHTSHNSHYHYSSVLQSTDQPHLTANMNSIKSAGNWITNKTRGGAHSASKETNKQIAKDPNVRTSTRIRAAGNAVKDKAQETNYNRKADVDKQAAKHNY